MDLLSRSRTQSLILGGVALGALCLVGFAIMASTAFAQAPGRIAFAVAVNLTLTPVAVMWWQGVRRAALPSWIAVAAFGWGVLVARLWAPHAPIALLIALGVLAQAITLGWLVLRLQRWARAQRRSPR